VAALSLIYKFIAVVNDEFPAILYKNDAISKERRWKYPQRHISESFSVGFLPMMAALAFFCYALPRPLWQLSTVTPRTASGSGRRRLCAIGKSL